MIGLKRCRLLVTPTSYGKNDPRFCSELESLVGEALYNWAKEGRFEETTQKAREFVEAVVKARAKPWSHGENPRYGESS